MENTQFRTLIEEVLVSKERKVLTAVEKQIFYQAVYEDAGKKIEDVRNEQKRAFEESMKLVLA